MKRALAAMLVGAAMTASAEFEISPDNLRDGEFVKDSESAKEVGLYCIHRGVTTATAMVLMDRSRSSILAAIPIRSTYATPRPAVEWLKVAWNAEGTAVAIHDSLNRDSKTLIYCAKGDGKFAAIALPDLRPINAKRIGLQVDSIRASGQAPVNWVKERLVTIEFRYLMADGKRYGRQYGIAFDEKWQPIQQ